MELFWWLLTIVLFAVGLIGTIAPVLPGTTIILAAAVIHRIMLGAEKSVGWWSIAILAALTLLTYLLDFLSGYFGAKYFGAKSACRATAKISINRSNALAAWPISSNSPS